MLRQSVHLQACTCESKAAGMVARPNRARHGSTLVCQQTHHTILLLNLVDMLEHASVVALHQCRCGLMWQCQLGKWPLAWLALMARSLRELLFVGSNRGYY